jgi:hypothetical protein
METDWAYDELVTFIDTNIPFQKRYVKPLEEKLNADRHSGIYVEELAVSLWSQIVDKAVDTYTAENKEVFDGLGATARIYPVAMRLALAKELADSYERNNPMDTIDKVVNAYLKIAEYTTTQKLELDIESLKELVKRHIYMEEHLLIDKVVNAYLKIAELDDTAIQELEQYIEGTEELEKRLRYMEENLLIKLARGVYDHTKSVDLWMYLADQAARDYVKENSPGDSIRDIFPKPERTEVAKMLADTFAGEYDLRKVSLKNKVEPSKVSKTTLKKYGELDELLKGASSIISTAERIAGMIEDVADDVEGFNKDWLKIERLPRLSA